ncbi:MAG: PilZ domain-containing protein [Desulfobacteraceae bacterium]|nr:PilZ domain-containing protein [Desulfobacteraceae bacterium]MBC2753604.1 PilZ domain-containing protein [Desulfobacteraceae bacterium]
MRQRKNDTERNLRRSQNKQMRRHARTPCDENTHFAANRRLFEGKIVNLSAGGTYIQSKAQFFVGQNVVVAGPFADDQSEMKRQGKIVRLDAQGFAVRFLY